MAVDVLFPNPADQYVICTSTTRPVSPANGTMIYETDTRFMYVWDLVVWMKIGPKAYFVGDAAFSAGSSATVWTGIPLMAQAIYRVGHAGPSGTLTIQTPGMYRLTIQGAWATNAAGARWLAMTKNSTTPTGYLADTPCGAAAKGDAAASGIGLRQSAVAEVPLVAGDIIRCYYRQDSAASIATEVQMSVVEI